MPDHEEMAPLIREWVKKAENDLLTAVHTLKLGKLAPPETISFHAQQCVEKYLKAVLVMQGETVPKIHDIEVLLFMVRPENRPALSPSDQDRLTR